MVGPWSSLVIFFGLLGQDLLRVVEESQRKGYVLGVVNSTFIDLIPKCTKPESYNELRPISLCNLIYKIIFKIIAD